MLNQALAQFLMDYEKGDFFSACFSPFAFSFLAFETTQFS